MLKEALLVSLAQKPTVTTAQLVMALPLKPMLPQIIKPNL